MSPHTKPKGPQSYTAKLGDKWGSWLGKDKAPNRQSQRHPTVYRSFDPKQTPLTATASWKHSGSFQLVFWHRTCACHSSICSHRHSSNAKNCVAWELPKPSSKEFLLLLVWTAEMRTNEDELKAGCSYQWRGGPVKTPRGVNKARLWLLGKEKHDHGLGKGNSPVERVSFWWAFEVNTKAGGIYLCVDL